MLPSTFVRIIPRISKRLYRIRLRLCECFLLQITSITASSCFDIIVHFAIFSNFFRRKTSKANCSSLLDHIASEHIFTDRVTSVCMQVTTACSAKTDKPIDMWTRGPNKYRREPTVHLVSSEQICFMHTSETVCTDCTGLG